MRSRSTRCAFFAFLFCVVAGARAQVSCPIASFSVDLFHGGGGASIFGVSPLPPVVVNPDRDVTLGAYCEVGGGQYPPPAISGATYRWSTGETSQRITVLAPHAGQSATYSVVITAPQGIVTIAATLVAAAPGTPRCTVVKDDDQPVAPGGVFSLKAECTPIATKSTWRIASWLGITELDISGARATMQLTTAQPGDVIPVYFVPEDAVGQGPPASILIEVGKPSSSLLPYNAAQVVPGGTQTCALTTAGGAKCWGDNRLGQLGDTTNLFYSTVPRNVIALGSDVTQLAGGLSHTCALRPDGAVKCWGANAHGELGDGTIVNSHTLVNVVQLAGPAFAIGSGPAAEHTCAALEAGGVQCWGRNDFGQLGDGTLSDNSVPVAVSGLPRRIDAVTAGTGHTCSLDSSGVVECWGRNDRGQLGNGTTLSSRVPVQVQGLSRTKAISAGADHACAIDADGAVFCWGANSYGQLGDGTTRDHSRPTRVAGVTAGSLSAGGYHTCAVDAQIGAVCWGRGNEGQLGNGAAASSNLPVPVRGIGTLADTMHSGGLHSCVIVEGGAVLCWGSNVSGMLGDGTSAYRTRPRLVLGQVGRQFLDLTLEDGSPSLAGFSTFDVETTGETAAKTTVVADIKFRPQDIGKPIYVFAYAPASLVKRKAGAKDDGGACLLSQAASDGALHETAATGLDPYVGALVGNQRQSVTILSNAATSNVSGATFCVGVGITGAESINPQSSTCVATIPGDAVCLPPEPKADSPGALSGLWWNPSEAGWGIDLTQRGDKVFAAWFTYDAGGHPKWYVASDCRMAAPPASPFGSCAGALYETTGPDFFGAAFDSGLVAIKQAGTMELQFSDVDDALLAYSIGGVNRSVFITRQMFGYGSTVPQTDFTDLWWNPDEPGWGVAITQQHDVMFLAWFVYDAQGMPVWLVASNCAATASGGCSGPLYRVTGPAFGPSFDASRVNAFQAGSVNVQFVDPNNGTLTWRVNGVNSSRAITRQLF